MAPLAPSDGRTAECAAKAEAVDTLAVLERSRRSRGSRTRTVFRCDVKEEINPAARKKARKCGVVVDVPRYGPKSKPNHDSLLIASISWALGRDRKV